MHVGRPGCQPETLLEVCSSETVIDSSPMHYKETTLTKSAVATRLLRLVAPEDS